MTQFILRALVVAVAALIAAPFVTFPPAGPLCVGAIVGLFLFGPMFGAVGRAIGDVEGNKALDKFAESVDKLLAAGNVPLARKLIARVREGCT